MYGRGLWSQNSGGRGQRTLSVRPAWVIQGALVPKETNGGSKTDLCGECPQNPYNWVKYERGGFRGKVVLLI